MRNEGVLVPGAQPGRKGSGCFKLSAEEKARMGEAAKSAAKKLKGVGKVNGDSDGYVLIYACSRRLLLKLLKRRRRRLGVAQRRFQPRNLQQRLRSLFPSQRRLLRSRLLHF